MKRHSSGFTIIEVMIVLAIAGLIMLIVFLAIPALQRSVRNHGRKVAVESVYTQLHDYYNTHSRYPLYEDGTNCAGTPSCAGFVTQVDTKGTIGTFTVDYGDNTREHYYPFTLHDSSVPADALDKVIIFPAHRCQRSTTKSIGDDDYPVYTAGASDNNFQRLAVYTVLEPDTVFCIDDSN